MNRALISGLGVCILVSGCVSTSAVPSGTRATLRKFDIPAEDATVALNEWSRQGNKQVLFDFSELRGRQTRAVAGTLEPSEALKLMLKDSGLNVSTVNERTIAIGLER